MIKTLNEQTFLSKDNDFVECLMYSRTSGVVMTGTMTDEAVSNKVTIII